MRRPMVAATVASLAAMVVLPGCGSDDGQLDTSEPWDMVWFSDSSGFFVADQWADRIEGELGVEVRVHDYAKGSLSAVEVLDSLDGNDDGSYSRLGDLRDEVAEAEVIVIYGNPVESGETSDIEICVSTDTTPREPPIHFSEADFAPYRQVLTSIYDIVEELRGDQATIVRAIDLYVPVIADWRVAGIDAECTAAWETWSQTIQNTAAEYGVLTVSMFDEFNGADHSEDPREKGFIISDGEHTTPAGQAAMVEALDSAGYDVSTLGSEG